jgi:salicylate hydroxylase
MSGARRSTATNRLPAGRSMKLEGLSVCVLGAGIAGLAAAIVLAGRGARVEVVEQATSLQEVGAGLQVSPNGAAVLAALGLGDELRAAARAAQAIELFDGRTDARLLRLDLAALRPDHPTSFVHRADLVHLLERAARTRGVALRLGCPVAAVELGPGRARAIAPDGQEIAAPDLLIGADGLHSILRPAIDTRSAPFFTGQVAWRALIPAEPGASPVAEIHMGPGRHLVTYPLRGGALRNIVAVEERARWVEESWSLRDDTLDLRYAFADFSDRVRAWIAAVDQPWLWGLFRHKVAARWFWRAEGSGQGGAALIGDAAHPMLPFLAQGANMALEDAWVLGAALAGARDIAEGLAAYQAARRPRAARVVAASGGAARLYHLGDPVRAVAHAGLRLAGRLAPAAVLGRFDWIHRHDVTA